MNCLEKKVLGHAENATRYIYTTIPVDPVHPIEHTERVFLNTLLVCRGEGISLLKPGAAAWLHNYGRPAEYLTHLKGRKLNHAEGSASQVPIILHPFRDSLGRDTIQEIQTAVALHSKLNSPDDSPTTTILKDADRLDGLGSVGLCRTITAAQNRPLCNPSNPFPDKIALGNITLAEMTLAERMLFTIEWVAMLRVPTAIQIGLSRVQKQIGFLEGLVEELGLSKSLLEQNQIIAEAKRVMQQIINETPGFNYS